MLCFIQHRRISAIQFQFFRQRQIAQKLETQGLELDIVGLCWGGDLRYDMNAGSWMESTFKTTC
jgi:hypothetical protein